MLVVHWHHHLSVETTLYYLGAVLNAGIGYQGMHLPYWRGQLEEAESGVRRLIRGYEVIPTEVPWCVPLRRPKQVRFCTGVSANLVWVICPIYLFFSTTKFDYSVFGPSYPQKCMMFLQKSAHNVCHFTHFSLKCTTFRGFSN